MYWSRSRDLLVLGWKFLYLFGWVRRWRNQTQNNNKQSTITTTEQKLNEKKPKFNWTNKRKSQQCNSSVNWDCSLNWTVRYAWPELFEMRFGYCLVIHVCCCMCSLFCLLPWSLPPPLLLLLLLLLCRWVGFRCCKCVYLCVCYCCCAPRKLRNKLSKQEIFVMNGCWCVVTLCNIYMSVPHFI